MARRRRGTLFNKQAPLSIGQRTKRILIWVGVLLGVVALLGVAAYLYALSWLQSDSCRSYLANAIRNATAAKEVSIPENLSIDGRRVSLPSCTVRGSGNIREFDIRKLHLEVDRLALLLRRALHLQHFSVEEMQLVFQLPSKAAAAAASKAAPTKSASISTSSSEVFVKDFKARSFESHYTDTTLIYEDRKFSLNGYRLAAVPRPEISRNAWAIGIENGRIRTPFAWLKESGVKHATLLYRGDDVQLSDCKIELAPGHLAAQGVCTIPGGLWKARVDVHQANVARLLTEDWRKRLTGELWGRLDLSGSVPKATWQASGELHLRNGVLEGLPILSDIKLNGTTPYRTIRLEKADCRVSFPYSEPEHGLHNAWLWDNIDIRGKDGTFLMRGRIITGMDGSLAGALSVGVPAKTLAELGLSKSPLVSKLFTAPVEVPGYVWVRINLSGTISNPQEDLSARMSTVLSECLPALADQAANSLQAVIGSFIPGSKHAEPETQDATEPEPPDAADKALQRGADKVRGIINSGLQTIF